MIDAMTIASAYAGYAAGRERKEEIERETAGLTPAEKATYLNERRRLDIEERRLQVEREKVRAIERKGGIGIFW